MLELRALRKTYGEKVALASVSFTIQSGEIIALLGVNGAGKSTLSAILAGLHPPTSGDLLFQGVSVYKDLVGYREKVGFCPQKPNIDDSLTLKKNLFFTGLYHRGKKKSVLAEVDRLIQLFSLEPYQEQKTALLSGGYRQRFLIARALVHKPSFLILDEPTIGLDPLTRKNLWMQIRALKEEGATVLLTTHYLEEAEEIADRVFIIDEGQVKISGTPEELKTSRNQKSLEEVFLQITGGDVDVS